ncbi:hypothetical protein DL93DRAFT_2092750 [Clavulina sp. PMI_390]|nr:hypothetical protein DL93DRAFT_2092750 [Clavulina sp. PMI_390]
MVDLYGIGIVLLGLLGAPIRQILDRGLDLGVAITSGKRASINAILLARMNEGSIRSIHPFGITLTDTQIPIHLAYGAASLGAAIRLHGLTSTGDPPTAVFAEHYQTDA